MGNRDVQLSRRTIVEVQAYAAELAAEAQLALATEQYADAQLAAVEAAAEAIRAAEAAAAVTATLTAAAEAARQRALQAEFDLLQAEQALRDFMRE